MKSKEFLINAVQMVEEDGSANIPTAIYYTKSGPKIGSEAFESTLRLSEVNVDFKIDLGNVDPSGSRKGKSFRTADGQLRTARGLSGDFLRGVLQCASRWLRTSTGATATHLLLAEPLSLHGQLTGQDWLSNYRGNLKRVLEREFKAEGFENINLEQIDFLPEPFAVFQYYRYGFRHPLIAERNKQNVFVIDFGGGTCDVCVIETTREGDISATGKNSRPLAASSIAVGGFAINEAIVYDTYVKSVLKPGQLASFDKGVKQYRRWRRNEIDIDEFRDEFRAFVDNYVSSIHAVEKAKLALCRSITDWSLDAEIKTTVPLTIPRDPFEKDGPSASVPLSASRFRELFCREIWAKAIKPTVGQTLKRAKEELNGTLSIVLLSGGSANIGWLEKLLVTEYSSELEGADLLRLPNYQEVVAKGLAVECARRFFNSDGDFAATTYNRLCLVIDPDDRGTELLDFKLRTPGFELHRERTPGVLLPSASALRDHLDHSLTWSFKVSHPPNKRLNYYFMRSSFDPRDIESLQNIGATVVHTPPDCRFDSHLKLELTVRPDGTAEPRFVYKSGQDDETSVRVVARPFYLDMTHGATGHATSAFIGLDFDTSNTAVSFVDAASVQVFRRRASEANWSELSDLVDRLPVVAAKPLAHYLGQTDATRLARAGRDCVEAMLTLCAYTAFLRYRAVQPTTSSRLFRGFTQRSAGPLWRLLLDCLERLDGDAMLRPLFQLQEERNHKLIDEAISAIADEKHQKLDSRDVDLLSAVNVLGNLTAQAFSDYKFGFFEDVRQKKFAVSKKEYEGRFRVAHGDGYFHDVLPYSGTENMHDLEACLWSPESSSGLRLQPLFFWDRCDRHPDEEFGHCFIFDKREKTEGKFSFKAAGAACTKTVEQGSIYDGLSAELTRWSESDPAISLVQI